MRTSSLFALLASLVFVTAAEDGAQVYNALCASCHGPDGKGLNGLPPLVGSEWPKGAPARTIKIVLSGMEGPVEVAGKTYNVVMPPQGAVLSDEKIAAVLTYVRKTFAGGAGAVSVDEVKAVRSATAERTTPWTAEELLKAHPFPPARTVLKNLVGTMFKGEWKEMPDFSTLKPALMEDFNLGVIDPAQAGLKDGFAMVWTAQFDAPVAGRYEFVFDCDDFGALYVGGETIFRTKWVKEGGETTPWCTLERATLEAQKVMPVCCPQPHALEGAFTFGYITRDSFEEVTGGSLVADDHYTEAEAPRQTGKGHSPRRTRHLLHRQRQGPGSDFIVRPHRRYQHRTQRHGGGQRR